MQAVTQAAGGKAKRAAPRSTIRGCLARTSHLLTSTSAARPLLALAITLVLAAGAYLFERYPHTSAGAPAAASATPAPPPGFETVDMRDATPADLDRAFAWRSVRVSEPLPHEVGEVAVALTPAEGGGPPMLWFPARKLLRAVLLPAGARPDARIVELGTYADGLAPARLQDPSGSLWGYVDGDGLWAVEPRFADAGSFVGGVAVVHGATGLQLVDHAGKALPWEPEDVSNTPGVASVAKTRLERLGRWTRITQAGAWVVVDNGRAAGEPSWVSDGTRVIRVPGVNAKASADGELWLLDTAAGPRLWTPGQGLLPTPAGLRPTLPLSAGLFLAPSKKDATSALVALDGRVIADPAPVLSALTPDRFIACTVPMASSAFDAADGARNVGPDLPNGRCGILDDQGAWWLQPDYRTIDRWSPAEVLVQGETQSCIVDLFERVAGCASGDGPQPRLDLGRDTPRLYRYADRNGNDVSPARYSGAWPFAGRVAEATVQGLPGLVDADGRWLTPRPQGDAVARAQQLAAALGHRPYLRDGAGLIDRAGHWAIPPVFGSLAWLADGSLRACANGAGFYDTACEHLDVHGQELATPAVDAPSSAAAPASQALPAIETGGDAPVAVARNGRWGYRDAHGDWTIPPRFDDATDFDGDRAAAAVDTAASAASAAEGMGAPTRRWGLIGLDGHWIAEPRFEQLGRFQGPAAIAREGGLFGLVDREGHWIAKPAFAAISDFRAGRATARRPDDTLCALDTRGRCSGADGLTALQDGPDRWSIGTRHTDTGDRMGYLEAPDHWAIEPRFTRAEPFQGDFAIARAEQPPVPADWPRRWIGIEVQRHVRAGLYAVGAAHPAATPPAPGQAEPERFAIADNQGRWLLPARPDPARK